MKFTDLFNPQPSKKLSYEDRLEELELREEAITIERQELSLEIDNKIVKYQADIEDTRTAMAQIITRYEGNIKSLEQIKTCIPMKDRL